MTDKEISKSSFSDTKTKIVNKYHQTQQLIVAKGRKVKSVISEKTNIIGNFISTYGSIAISYLNKGYVNLCANIEYCRN